MIRREAIDVMLQGIECRRRQHAGLPHAAAEQFAMPPGQLDELARARQRRTDRRPQSLAEANAHGVEVLRPIGRRNAGGHGRIPQPSAVQVGGQPDRMGPIANVGDRVVGQRSVRRRDCACSPATAVGCAANDRSRRASSLRAARAARRRPGRPPGARPARSTGRSRPARSCRYGSRPRDHFVAGEQWTVRPIWLDIVPEGTKIARSLPSRAATRSSRALTVGSSPKTSSPTAACGHGLAHAGRRPGDGVAPQIERFAEHRH